MICKFRAESPMPSVASFRLLFIALAPAALAVCLWPTQALAERGDRAKPLEVESDGANNAPGAVMDLGKKTVVISGNVIITQGSMRIRADRVELREAPDGRRTAVALGGPGKPASFRQKRDRVDEYVDATAERIEYDSRSDQIRFVGDARSRRLIGEAVADEATAQLIVYDNVADVVSLQGGAAAGSGTPGRTRLVLMPREAASEPAAAKPANEPAPAKPANEPPPARPANEPPPAKPAGGASK